jgi:hypothetical protein
VTGDLGVRRKAGVVLASRVEVFDSACVMLNERKSSDRIPARIEEYQHGPVRSLTIKAVTNQIPTSNVAKRSNALVISRPERDLIGLVPEALGDGWTPILSKCSGI